MDVHGNKSFLCDTIVKWAVFVAVIFVVVFYESDKFEKFFFSACVKRLWWFTIYISISNKHLFHYWIRMRMIKWFTAKKHRLSFSIKMSIPYPLCNSFNWPCISPFSYTNKTLLCALSWIFFNVQVAAFFLLIFICINQQANEMYTSISLLSFGHNVYTFSHFPSYHLSTVTMRTNVFFRLKVIFWLLEFIGWSFSYR